MKEADKQEKEGCKQGEEEMEGDDFSKCTSSIIFSKCYGVLFEVVIF